MPFEKFVPPRRQRSPQVSIKRTGTISFDKSYAQSVGLGNTNYVTLYFDPAKKLVGVKPAKDAKDDGSLKLSHRQRVSSVRAHPSRPQVTRSRKLVTGAQKREISPLTKRSLQD